MFSAGGKCLQGGRRKGNAHLDTAQALTQRAGVHGVHLRSQPHAWELIPSTVLVSTTEAGKGRGNGGGSRMSSPSIAPPASGIYLSLSSPKQNYEKGLRELGSKERSLEVVVMHLLLFDALRSHAFLYCFLLWPQELEGLTQGHSLLVASPGFCSFAESLGSMFSPNTNPAGGPSLTHGGEITCCGYEASLSQRGRKSACETKPLCFLKPGLHLSGDNR